MANKVPDNWQSLDWYVGPRPRLLERKSPYNLFGLKGESTKELSASWYGRPEHRYATAQQVRRNGESGWVYALGALPFSVLYMRFVGSGSIRMWLEQHSWAVWLAVVVLAVQAFVWYFPTPNEEQQMQQAREEMAARIQSGVLTVALRVPGASLLEPEPAPTVVVRRRHDPPCWSSDYPPGPLLVVLEGLRPDEAKAIYSAVTSLNSSD